MIPDSREGVSGLSCVYQRLCWSRYRVGCDKCDVGVSDNALEGMVLLLWRCTGVVLWRVSVVLCCNGGFVVMV